jgi:hypothetical protein
MRGQVLHGRCRLTWGVEIFRLGNSIQTLRRKRRRSERSIFLWLERIG